jgi:hypothetical protein
MSDPKFLALFSTLNADEASDFRKYLKRQAGTDSVALNVYDHLQKHPADRQLETAHLALKVFKTNAESDKKNLLNTFYDLHRWLRIYLMGQKAIDQSEAGHLLWLSILEDRNMTDEAAKHTTALRKTIDANKRRGTRDFQVSTILYEHSLRHPQIKANPESFSNLISFKKDLDSYYLLSQIKIACELANGKNIKSVESNMDHMKQVFELVELSNLGSNPLFRLYKEVYDLIVLHQEDNYNNLISLLYAHENHVNSDELMTLLSYLHNFAATQTRNGKETEYFIKTHQLNKFALDKGFLNNEINMSPAKFTNIVTASCIAGEFKWADMFIQDFSKLIHEELRFETKLLANSIISFELKQYQQTVQNLQKKDFKNFSNQIRAKLLLLRCLYETQSADALDFCRLFEAMLRRNNPGKTEPIKATLNTVLITKMLIHRNAPKQKILDAIGHTRPLYLITWLLHKAEGYDPV